MNCYWGYLNGWIEEVWGGNIEIEEGLGGLLSEST